jgi:hypothetical protein
VHTCVIAAVIASQLEEKACTLATSTGSVALQLAVGATSELSSPATTQVSADRVAVAAVAAAAAAELLSVKLDLDAPSALLPTRTNGDVERALQAYDKMGIPLRGFSAGTQRLLSANYLNYKGPPTTQPFYKPWPDGMIKKVLMYASGPPSFKQNEKKPFVGALASASVTEEGGIIAAGDMLCNKPKSRGVLAMDNKRESMCVGVMIPCPVLSKGDGQVKAVVVAFQGKYCDKEVWHDHLSFENMIQVTRSTHNYDTAATSRFSEHAKGVLETWLADDEREVCSQWPTAYPAEYWAVREQLKLDALAAKEGTCHDPPQKKKSKTSGTSKPKKVEKEKPSPPAEPPKEKKPPPPALAEWVQFLKENSTLEEFSHLSLSDRRAALRTLYHAEKAAMSGEAKSMSGRVSVVAPTPCPQGPHPPHHQLPPASVYPPYHPYPPYQGGYAYPAAPLPAYPPNGPPPPHVHHYGHGGAFPPPGHPPSPQFQQHGGAAPPPHGGGHWVYHQHQPY